MGNASGAELIRRCVGVEVAPSVVKSLAGASQNVFEAILARIKSMDDPPGLDTTQVVQVLGDGRGNHANLLIAIMGIKHGTGRVDFYEMLALLAVYGKIPARLKVRNLFDLFDMDFDGKLNSSETILMLRSVLSGIAKSTGGVSPRNSDVEAIWQHLVRLGYTDEEERLPFSKWVSFCSRTREVHALGKSLDFNKGVCRKSLTSGSRATLSAVSVREDETVLAAQRAALTKKPQERVAAAIEKKRASAARDGKNRFARSSVMRIKEVFDSLDKDGSGYVDENDWRRLTEDTPLAASDDTFLFIEREREGKISIVEVLNEVHPFAGDADLAKMLEWISEEPTQQGSSRLVNRELAVAEHMEIAALFNIYDTEGSGEVTLSTLASAMGEVVGLSKEDVMPMFSQSGKTEEDYITASEFADTLMEFVSSDASIQSLVQAI